MESALQQMERLASKTALPTFTAVGEEALEAAALSPQQTEIGLGMSLLAAGLIGVMVIVVNFVARAQIKKRQEEYAPASSNRCSALSSSPCLCAPNLDVCVLDLAWPNLDEFDANDRLCRAFQESKDMETKG